MGLVEDVLMLVGILPVPEFVKPKKTTEETFLSEGKLYNKTEELIRLNGQYVWINDFYDGVVAGDLIYEPCMNDSYILNNCIRSGRPKILKVHDLNHIILLD